MPRWRRQQRARMRLNPDRAAVDVDESGLHQPYYDSLIGSTGRFTWHCDCPRVHPHNRQRCKKCRKRRPW